MTNVSSAVKISVALLAVAALLATQLTTHKVCIILQ